MTDRSDITLRWWERGIGLAAIFFAGSVVGAMLAGNLIHPLSAEDKAVLEKMWEKCGV